MTFLYLTLTEDESKREKIIRLYEDYRPYMMHVATGYLTSTEDAEDVVHDAMLKLIRHLHRVDLADEVKTRNLCGVVVRQRALDHLDRRDNRNIPAGDIRRRPASADPVEIAEEEDAYSRILRVIGSMSETYRDPCLLKYVNNLTEKEIASLLGLSLKAVNQRIFRGRQILREMLVKEGFHE